MKYANLRLSCAELAVALFILTSSVAASRAAIVSVSVADDAATYSFQTAGGFGPGTATEMGNSVALYDSGGRSYLWLKFSLNPIPDGATINSARLYGSMYFLYNPLIILG